MTGQRNVDIQLMNAGHPSSLARHERSDIHWKTAGHRSHSQITTGTHSPHAVRTTARPIRSPTTKDGTASRIIAPPISATTTIPGSAGHVLRQAA